jgi:hypothetical protein
MASCPECGDEIDDASEFCSACGAQLTQSEPAADDDDFLQRYGARPLPLAKERGEFIGLYGNLLGNIPVLGGIMKLFSGISFWCYGLWVTFFKVITGNADVVDRFDADFSYLKDNFYSGFNDSEAPPVPPK